MSPYRLFTGCRINYKKSLALGFGDYCGVYNGTDNTSRSHSFPFIALHPCNNSTGSWQFLNITSGVMIKRSNWRWMVRTQAIIDKINGMLTVIPQEEVVPTQDLIDKVLPSEVVADQIDREMTEESVMPQQNENVDVSQPAPLVPSVETRPPQDER